MKKLLSHGWCRHAPSCGRCVLAVPTVSASAATSEEIQGKAPAAVPANDAPPRRRRRELIEFDIGLKLKDLPGAEALAKEVTDPTEPLLPQVPDPTAVGEAASRRACRAWTGKSWPRCAPPASRSRRCAPDRMTIIAEGTAEQIEAYFETTLADYEVGEETLGAPRVIVTERSDQRGAADHRRAKSTSTRHRRTSPAPNLTAGAVPAVTATARGAGAVTATEGAGSTDGTATGLRRIAQEEEVEEIEQPLGFRNATPCSAYYGQELANPLPAFRRRLPEPGCPTRCAGLARPARSCSRCGEVVCGDRPRLHPGDH